MISNPVYTALTKHIILAAKKAYPDQSSWDFENIYAALTLPPQKDMGHYCFPCFPLSKQLKHPPHLIAKKIVEHMEASSHIQAVSPQGPYINFTLFPMVLGESFLKPIREGSFFEQKLALESLPIMLEYSQPNTHKILHVGHMRNLCLGNALNNILAYVGHRVKTATYPGDMGTHVAKCLWYLKNHHREDIPSQQSDPQKGEWLGRLYPRAVQEYDKRIKTPEKATLKETIGRILKEIHQKQGDYYDLWRKTRLWSLALMEEVYRWADVSFDHWFWESEMDAPSLALVQKLYKDGLLIKDDGAIGMDLKEDKLGFCLLVKQDGTGLYATKDIELARKKLEEYAVEQNIYIVDNRQTLHFKQVFKTLEKLGIPNADKCFHLQYEMVELPEGPMSSRGNRVVALTDLIEQMEATVIQDYLQKYLDNPTDSWSKEEVDKTAKIIASGAVKYGMVSVDNNRKIIFNMKEWLKLEGETGPYLQYVCARIHSLKRKLNGPTGKICWEELSAPQELNLMVQLGEFNNIVVRCARQLKTMPLCSYLYDLGKLFNAFYTECPMAKAQTKSLQRSRLALADATGKILEKGLSLLGIKAPERM